jgi:hypothetical protein
MIPPFDDNGFLPPGIHPATVDEIADRFGQEPEVRRAQMESIRWLVEIAQRAGIERIVLNGSFVTDQYEPNDVDCVLLVDRSARLDRDAMDELIQGLPFLELNIVERTEFDLLTQYFETDRFRNRKGMLEVIP